MQRPLEERIKKYVTEAAPLGPPDAHQIKDDEAAAHLFDPHNKSFNALLRREISIVIGRRGSGKTALLNSYRYNRFFDKDNFLKTNYAGVDLTRYQIVIEVKTHLKSFPFGFLYQFFPKDSDQLGFDQFQNRLTLKKNHL